MSIHTSIKRVIVFTISIVMTTYITFAHADEEGVNPPYVAAGAEGTCYVKSLPKHDFDPYEEPRQQGETKVYEVGKVKDMLISTYNWYSNRIFVKCNATKENDFGIAVIRLGPWHRGHTPNDTDLAIAFYFNGKLIKHYSTSDIVKEPIMGSVSHYTVFKTIPGFRDIWKTIEHSDYIENAYDKTVFDIVTVDGRKLTFDLGTGKIIESEKVKKEEN